MVNYIRCIDLVYYFPTFYSPQRISLSNPGRDGVLIRK